MSSIKKRDAEALILYIKLSTLGGSIDAFTRLKSLTKTEFNEVKWHSCINYKKK